MIFRNWFDNEPKETMFCAVVSLIALILSLGGWGRELIPVDTAWIAIVLCGIPIVTGAAVALIREHDIKADLLVSIALIASVATREYFAAGEVALIMQIGSLLEDFTADRARKGIEGLIRLTPKTARVVRSGIETIVAAEEVRAGDRLVVLAGEMIPADGILVSGETSVDQSVMTGESTVICTAVNGSPVGMVALSDTLRPDAVQTVAGIKSVGITPMLLTGDNAAAAGTVCDAVGIGEVRSGLLPEDKLNIVRREGGRKVCMIGDGVNDAPAISAAYAGIAMGGIGSDIAVESADAVLVGDEISRLPYLFRLTKKAMRKVRQNITFSMIFNFAAIILSGFGILTPVTAALVHNFGSVFVVVNAAMLLAENDGGEQKRKERGSAATQAAAEQVL